MMKKLFLFRSSASSNANVNPISPTSNNKQVYWEKPSNSAKKCKSKKQASDGPPKGNTPCLRRSLSFSGSVYDHGIQQKNYNDEGGSPNSSNYVRVGISGRLSTRCRALTPERQSKAKCSDAAVVQNAPRLESRGYFSSVRSNYESSECSSNCSSNVSSRVLDRFIDGEQEDRNSVGKSSSSFRRHTKNVNGSGKRPPRVQYTAPGSPIDRRQKPTCHSFREDKGSHYHFSPQDFVENGFGHVARLSRTQGLPKFEPDTPITIEDIYDGSLNRFSDEVPEKNVTLDGPYESTDKHHHREIPDLLESNFFSRGSSVQNEDNIDTELLAKSKKADQRAMFLAEQLERETFLHDSGLNLPALIQTIRDLTEEKASMALEISSTLHDQIADKASAKDELNLVRSELDSRIRRLEKEKNELQSALEKELDRRSSEWSKKLEKYQAEEHRLRERVRELAEQNVFLQRDVSSCNEREMGSKNRISCLELQINDLTESMEKVKEKNESLMVNLAMLQERCNEAEEDRDCLRRNFEEKERECKDLHRSVTRLLRTCEDQEKTIDGLQEGLTKEMGKNTSLDKFEIQVRKLQMEQMRLAGVERALRKEVESYRREVDSLRGENINLLYRLKGISDDSGSSTLKLEQELRSRVHIVQNQGVLLLSESTQLCMKLLEHIKGKAGYTPESKQANQLTKHNLDGQFIVESDVKVHGFKRGMEKLVKSLETLSVVLLEKSLPVNTESVSNNLDDCSGQLSGQKAKTKSEKLQTELRAETMLTSLLREKLYSNELEVEQLQAELAAAVRGNDILRCEVQNTMDTLSCMTHKMKDLELLMIKKDENMTQLQNDLHERTKELTILKGVLPKVSEERDMMWEEVKQYSEKNMLLNSEVNVLKKRIEDLDEDILLKEGQITILKDSLAKPFNLIGSPDSTREFLLE